MSWTFQGWLRGPGHKSPHWNGQYTMNTMKSNLVKVVCNNVKQRILTSHINIIFNWTHLWPELDNVLLSMSGLTAGGWPAECLQSELHLLSQHLQHPQPLHNHRGGHLTSDIWHYSLEWWKPSKKFLAHELLMSLKKGYFSTILWFK